MRHLIAPCVLALAAASHAPAAHLQSKQVSDSIYVVRPVPGDTRAVSNAAFLVLSDRVVVFDTLSNGELMGEMMALIEATTNLPVQAVVLSHWHPDHAGGLEYFRGRPYTLFMTPETSAGISAYRRRMVANLEKRERDLQRQLERAVDEEDAETTRSRLAKVRSGKLRLLGLPAAKADTEVIARTDFAPQGRMLRLENRGPGHTDGDLTIYAPQEKVLLAGDLLSVRTLPNLSDGYTGAWLDRLAEIQRREVRHIVPGHGPVGTMKDVEALRSYLESLRTLVRPIVADGGTSRDLVEKLRVPERFSTWGSSDLWFPATLRAFHELQGHIEPPPQTSR